MTQFELPSLRIEGRHASKVFSKMPPRWEIELHLAVRTARPTIPQDTCKTLLKTLLENAI